MIRATCTRHTPYWAKIVVSLRQIQGLLRLQSMWHKDDLWACHTSQLTTPKPTQWLLSKLTKGWIAYQYALAKWKKIQAVNKIDMRGGQNKQIHDVRQLLFDTDRGMAKLVLWLQISLWPLATVYHGLFVFTFKTQPQSYACT